MDSDDAPYESQDAGQDIDSQNTAQQTQSTQQATQPTDGVDSHLWGFLQPCSASLTRLDFWKAQPSYTIGRNNDQKVNNIVFTGFKVSNQHCKIVWDGKDSKDSAIVIHDYSSNGTFINGKKIGKGLTGILREGNELAFGTCLPQPRNPYEDYRYVFRLVAGGPPSGLHAFYDISHELGKGSFATVMKAVSRTTGHWYAVKMIQDTKSQQRNGTHDPAAGNAHQAARSTAFAREISILEKLKHGNICELKEVFFEETNISLVLELVEGGDLLDYILTNNGLSEGLTKHITYQICDALAYIHQMGIAHRDLKPENVLLTKDNPPIVKVADFGLAKVVDSLTMLRTMCGTPSYLAPEVVLQTNNSGYDNLVDSWSVGVIVFSMLTNASPFIEDETQRDIRTRIAERQIDWSTLCNSQVSDEAHDFIRQLLEFQPSVRLTLTDALRHPWLTSYTPVYDLSRYRDGTASASTTPSMISIPNDVSMISSLPENDAPPRSSLNGAGSVSDGFERLQLAQPPLVPADQRVVSASQDSTSAMVAGIPGAFPRATTEENGAAAAALRGTPLKRRSDVMSQIIEAGAMPIEPSWEMIQNDAKNALAAGTAAAGAAGASTGPGTRGNKRVHSELTPLPEEMEDAINGDIHGDVGDVGEANGVSEPANGTKKRGKSSEGEAPPKAGRGGGIVAAAKTGRGRGRGASAPANNAPRTLRPRPAEGSEDEESVLKPRRSARQTPQKIARRV